MSRKRVEHQVVHTAKQCLRFPRHAAEIRQVGHAADAKAKHLHVAVLGRHRRPPHAQQLERPVDHVRADQRNGTECRLAVEHIGECAPQNLESFSGGINRHSRTLAHVEGPDIVESQDVIGVGVRKDDGVEAVELLPQSLESENRAWCRLPRDGRRAKAAPRAACGCRADRSSCRRDSGSPGSERPSMCRSPARSAAEMLLARAGKQAPQNTQSAELEVEVVYRFAVMQSKPQSKPHPDRGISPKPAEFLQSKNAL